MCVAEDLLWNATTVAIAFVGNNYFDICYDSGTIKVKGDQLEIINTDLHRLNLHLNGRIFLNFHKYLCWAIMHA